MTYRLYGIKNCDTMKKAMKWLNDNGIAYDFHDYKKEGADESVLTRAIKTHGWEIVINKRGTTWRKLPKETQDRMDADLAVETALANPSIIKRPVLEGPDDLLVGFDESGWKSLLK